MKIVEPSARIIHPEYLQTAVEHISNATRQAYASSIPEDVDPAEANENLLRSCMRRGHTSVLEHVSMSVLLQTDRGVANELVRHRVASYTQNSTRYINYSKRKFNKEISVVRPSGIEENSPADILWRQSVQCAENAYMSLVRFVPPETARAVLPLCTATTIMCSANLREWLHIFNLRVLGTTGKPHPDIIKLLAPVLLQMGELVPEIFGELAARYNSCEPYSPAL